MRRALTKIALRTRWRSDELLEACSAQNMGRMPADFPSLRSAGSHTGEGVSAGRCFGSEVQRRSPAERRMRWPTPGPQGFAPPLGPKTGNRSRHFSRCQCLAPDDDTLCRTGMSNKSAPHHCRVRATVMLATDRAAASEQRAPASRTEFW